MSDGASHDTKGQSGIPAAALFGLCPRCGEKTLFAGLARFAPSCSACGLDFSRFNVGDGPAAFLTMVIGTLVTALALWVELAFAPEWWVHLLLWLPLVTGLTLGGLRVAKAGLLAAEYRRQAREATGGDITPP